MDQIAEPGLVDVDVAQDRMNAWVQPAPDADLSLIDSEQVQSAVTAADIAVDAGVLERIEQFVKTASSEEPPTERFLIAEGRAPVEGTNGRFDWSEGLDQISVTEEDENIDFRAQSSTRMIKEGDVVGRITPPVEGQPGVDVSGRRLDPVRFIEAIKIGSNVRLLDNGDVVAACAGNAQFERGEVDVDEILDIAGDVDYESGNIDAECDVHIRGSVLDEFVVKSKKSITVDGLIQAATVEAGEDVLVRRGIVGRERATVTAEGTISAKFCEEATLKAGGDVRIGKSLVNSQVRCEGAFFGEGAKIVGGSLHARNGITIGTLGNDAGAPTAITVGVPPQDLGDDGDASSAMDKYAELCREKQKQEEASIARLEQAVETIRASAGPVLRRRDELPAAMCEKAEFLLAQADRIEQQIEAMRAALGRASEESEALGTADIVLKSQAFAKVVLTIDDRRCHLTAPVRGPARIEKRKVENVTEITVVNELTGSLTLLKSGRSTGD